MNYKVWIDGGSRRNGSEDQEAYGSSLSVRMGSRKSTRKQYEFGNHTNNQAEFLVLIEVLNNILLAIISGFLNKGDTIVIYSDSMRIVQQYNEFEKSKILKRYQDTALVLRDSIAERGVILDVVKANRNSIVSILGH